MKNLNPDTFFFVKFIINEKPYLYGPYLDLSTAIQILVDLAPSIAANMNIGKSYTYESMIHEKILSNVDNGEIEWKTINIPLKEEKSKYIKKNK